MQVMLRHLRELMADASTYEWEPVQAYHAIWFRHLENGWVEWEDTDLKLEFCHALVWNSAQHSNPSPMPPSAPRQPPANDTAPKPVTAEPGTKACALYNQGKCRAQPDQP